jgi:hypothetical protein
MSFGLIVILMIVFLGKSTLARLGEIIFEGLDPLGLLCQLLVFLLEFVLESLKLRLLLF